MKMVSLPTSSDADIKEALKGLKDIAGDLEIGLAVISNKNIDSVVKLLGAPRKPAIRLEAARVLGVSLQNNLAALKEAHKLDLVSKLLLAIEQEDDLKALDRQLFALSASVRADQLELEAFYRSRGDRVLLDVFSKSKEESVRRRILSVIVDVADPALQPESSEGLDQEVSLLKKLDPSLKESISSWCELLEKESIGALGELASEALAGLAKLFPGYCHTS
ncbi:nucleotide exchange factor sil1 [Entomophthora muscae]|uniref:Nucleotide exchange factor sil1 n=1 Tax=Entomophthora muscae TaxID=34485 RepID=A0ACC2T123_9FUNG|nr:nucleotide exchange factor sil1 [Entomophthora muscae]